jgi:hypothetical protein
VRNIRNFYGDPPFFHWTGQHVLDHALNRGLGFVPTGASPPQALIVRLRALP